MTPEQVKEINDMGLLLLACIFIPMAVMIVHLIVEIIRNK